MKRHRLILLALLLCAAPAGCGSGSTSTSTIATTASKPAANADASGAGAQGAAAGHGAVHHKDKHPPDAEPQAAHEPHFTPKPHPDSGGGSGQFEEKGGDNSIQRFGAEASGSEFTQAAAALHDYLDARAQRAWAAACSYLQASVAESLSQLAGGKKAPCSKLLAGLSAGLPPRVLREAAIADVGALRTEGERAFLLFTGAHGTRYFIPMAKEDGRWKVAAIAPSALS